MSIHLLRDQGTALDKQHQQTVINWFNPEAQNPLETTSGYEQTAIEDAR